MSIATVLGTRPELVKMAPVMAALGKKSILIHSGQHYDDALSANFIKELSIAEPDYYLNIGSGTQANQTAQCMVKLEQALIDSSPDLVLVQGDTNTVLAGALTAVKMDIPVGHVEAGLRSNDRRMPEEYNRRVADHISHLLFAPTKSSAQILESEKVWGDIHTTGNTVIDACEMYAPAAKKLDMDFLKFDDFIFVTAHRAENVDNPAVLNNLVDALISAPLPVVYAVHPRTLKRLKDSKLYGKLSKSQNIQLIPPVGYLESLALMQRCRFIFTDSGGIQEEATSPSIRKRILVFRKSTERPEAVAAGYATIVGTEKDAVLKAMKAEAKDEIKLTVPSPYGDGKAGKRIAKISLKYARELQ